MPYLKMEPDDATAVDALLRAPASNELMKHDQVIAYKKITCAAAFNTKVMNIGSKPSEKSGTMTFEVLYKNAVGDLKLQASVSGDYWADIYSGTTQAKVTLADSGTVQTQIINLSVGSYGGNYLRAVWSGTGTGWIAINVT